eukprot:comp18278_c0_seq1/m.19296 comp18278_c0_seq1/g.19296  ORF comp18278_c0_seq1/g.19296 comp18278_c0_seq1/m.19296 type:complete len:168 (-) comp18278_c0_seq1:122-625(-)
MALSQNLLDTLEAAEMGDVEKLSFLLKEVPQAVEWRDHDGYTALHRAAYNNHLEAAQYLVAHGANPTAQTHDGWQPLHSACRWGSLEVARYLLQIGVDVNAKTNGGQTALHLSCQFHHHDCILLVGSWPGIDWGLDNGQGDTPMDLILRVGDEDLWELGRQLRDASR